MAPEWTAKRLQKLMDEVGYDALSLAASLVVSPQSVLNWLNGKYGIRLVYRRKLEAIERRLARARAVAP